MRKYSPIKYFLVYFIILIATLSFVLSLGETQPEYDAAAQAEIIEGPGGVRENEIQVVYDYVERDLEHNIEIDFSQRVYKDYSQDIILQALKKKYPDLDITSVKGVKIKGDTLTTADNSKIDLKTGKKLKLETDGSQITKFDDGSGTACTNCKGVTYTQDDFKVESGGEVQYAGSTSTAVNNYEGKIGTFSADSAGIVVIGENVFNDVKDSTFSIINNKLVYADVKSSKDNNTATLENPIQINFV